MTPKRTCCSTTGTPNLSPPCVAPSNHRRHCGRVTARRAVSTGQVWDGDLSAAFPESYRAAEHAKTAPAAFGEDRFDPAWGGCYALSVCFARSTSIAKPAGSFTAMSARTLRSSSISAFLRPFMNREYDMPFK